MSAFAATRPPEATGLCQAKSASDDLVLVWVISLLRSPQAANPPLEKSGVGLEVSGHIALPGSRLCPIHLLCDRVTSIF